LNDIKTNYGNVLDKEYIFTFGEIEEIDNESTEDTELKYVPKYNLSEYTQGFIFSESKDDIGNITLSSTLSLTIDENTFIEIKDGKLRSHIFKLKITSTRANADGTDVDENKTREYISNISPIIKNYDPISRTITFDFEIVVSKLKLAYLTKFEKILSVVLTLEGNYITSSDVTESVGEGNKILKLENNELVQNTNLIITEESVEIKLIGLNSSLTQLALKFINIEFESNYPFPSDFISYRGYVCRISIESQTNKKIISVDRLDVEKEGVEYFIDNIENTKETVYTTINSNTHIMRTVLSNYKDGKETAKILCSLVDDSVLTTHSRVIPMVLDSNGNDVAMSKYLDGSDKVFDVVGVSVIYDGAIWQELTLQEVAQSNTIK
jgi:hypothetical protein